MSRSGKGSVLVSNGDIVIDSSSSTAGMIVGGGSVSAANIAVTGNLQAAGPGKFVGTVDEGSAALADPLANLIQPAAPAASFNNTVVRSKTVTLAPGTYVNGIRVYGNSNVTLLPGLYYLQSGGLIVNGSSKLTGTGVSIFNAPANSSGSIDIDTTGSVRSRRRQRRIPRNRHFPKSHVQRTAGFRWRKLEPGRRGLCGQRHGQILQ